MPPTRYSSAIMTRAPWPAAMRAARTPPEPAADDEQIDVEISHAHSPSDVTVARPDQRLWPRFFISARSLAITSSRELVLAQSFVHRSCVIDEYLGSRSISFLPSGDL